MKKLITLLLLVLCSTSATVYAQDDLYFTYEGKKIQNGATLTFNAKETITDMGDGDIFADVKATTGGPGDENGLFLKNSSGQKIMVNGVTTILSRDEGARASWCAFGNCTSDNGADKIEKLNKPVEAGTNEAMELDAFFDYQKYGNLKTKLTINRGGTELTVNVNFVYSDLSGIQFENANAGSTKLINNELVYSFDQPAKRLLNIYSVTGALLRNHSMSQSGTISLRDLSKGMYIYEVIENGKRIASHKCVIK